MRLLFKYGHKIAYTDNVDDFEFKLEIETPFRAIPPQNFCDPKMPFEWKIECIVETQESVINDWTIAVNFCL